MRWQGFLQQAISAGVAFVCQPFSPRCGLRVLMYHSIGSSVYGDRHSLNSLSPERFRKHVDLLAGMLTVSLMQLKIPENELHVAVTFDDGYADNLYIAAPLLAERGIPFAVFVSSDFIRNRVTGFLSSQELKQLAQTPDVMIGSHGSSHCHLNHCSDRQLRSELLDSRHYLEDLIGRRVTSLAYPYGSSDRRVRDAALSAGYELGVCSRFDINHSTRDPLMLNRCVILSDDNLRIFRQKLHGDWDWYRFRHIDPLKINSVYY